MQSTIFGLFFISCIASVIATFFVSLLMARWRIVDRPKTLLRKIHKKAVPLGGGLAVYLVTAGVLVAVLLTDPELLLSDMKPVHIAGALLGGLILIVSGLIDDAKDMRPVWQFGWIVLAAIVAIAFGVGPHQVTNPLTGGILELDRWVIPMSGIGNWVVLADIMVFLWLIAMMFTTKLLDGLDGLVTGIVAIGAGIIVFVSMQPEWYQPGVALAAGIFSGALVGFLVWNFHPAKVFLGQGGSLFAGFFLGILAIISGSKIATTFLVMGVPMLDMGRVILRRIGRKRSPFIGDNEHLHFQLLKSGLSHRQAVLLLYSIALLFGLTTLFLQSSQKMIALVFLLVLMLLVGIRFSRK